MIRALAVLSLMFVLSVPARADTLAPCSPNCDPFLGPYLSLDLVVPATAFDVWPGDPYSIPEGLFQIGYYSTPALDDLSIFSVLLEAYESSGFNYAGPIRHARSLTSRFWADYENGNSSWSKGPGGFMTNSDDPVPISNPEPGTWLLIGTGILLVAYAAKRKRATVSL